ncbi:filamin [Oceaniferula spumae]|uniref:Filamin n=1 Tax=Oceaniferula spumae TaxID=2979115 RepID=A0AAT9FKL8_9BACT
MSRHQTTRKKHGLSLLCLVASLIPTASAEEVTFDGHIQPLLKEYCYKCHGEGKKLKGDLDLTTFTSEKEVFAKRKIWLEVLYQIESEEMPTKEPLPTAEERKAMVAWLNKKLNNVDWSKVRDAGHVTIPRLTKTEYNNTMRDLLGVDLRAGHILSDDGEGQSGFTTDRANLFLSPAAMEKYFMAARKALDTLTAEPIKPISKQVEAETMFMTETSVKPSKVAGITGYNLRIGQMTLYESVDFPADGIYKIRTHAVPTDLSVGSLTMRIDNEPKGTLKYTGSSPSIQEITCFVTKGAHQISWNIAGRNGKKEKKKKGPKTKSPKTNGPVTVDWVKVEGPENSGIGVDKRHVFHVLPGPDVTEDQAAQRIIARFAQRAARRPMSGSTTNRYYNLYKKASAKGESFEDSVKLALTAILVSPHFLYRNELAPTGNDEEFALDDYQIASRLSYFLWMSMPDDELFTLAEGGKLRDPIVLRQQVKRMLLDPKARDFTSAFLGQWLGFEALGVNVLPDEKLFPEFNPQLAEAMKQETVLTFEHLIRNGHSLLTLLDTNATYLNEDLANHYGIPGVKGAKMRPVLLKDSNRGGLLGMASVLTATSSPTRTSPVLRGKWVVETLLGERIPEPPADVPELTANAGLKKNMTLREELEAHRKKEECASCHDRIDPIGFGMENYDAIGRFRKKEAGGQLIDSSGTLDGFKFSGAAELKAWLMKERKKQFIRNISERMLAFALGREIATFDEAPLRKITAALEKNDYQASTLIEEIVLSYPFLHQNNSPPNPDEK